MNFQDLTLDVEQRVQIAAPNAEVYERLIDRLTENNISPSGEPMPMLLERRPGGRWYRDLGDDSGHLWAIVQSYRPPTLLEFFGPLVMSYPVSGHLIIRLEENNQGTLLWLRHQALGLIDAEHREGIVAGWTHYVSLVKQDCE